MSDNIGRLKRDKDIAVDSVAVEDSERALEEHKSGGFDQLHADDFLIYAYLQSGREAKAKEVLDSSGEAIDHLQAMPDMGDGMAAMGMETFYRTELQMIYDLELRDWQAALALRPTAGGGGEDEAAGDLGEGGCGWASEGCAAGAG